MVYFVRKIKGKRFLTTRPEKFRESVFCLEVGFVISKSQCLFEDMNQRVLLNCEDAILTSLGQRKISDWL